MTFKLAQLSDPHIGYSSTRHVDKQGINLRVRDGYKALAEAVTQMIAEGVDATLWPGDIFHVPEPKIRDIIFMQNQLRRLADAGIPCYLLAGNHDALDKASEIAASRVVHDPWRKIFSEHDPYVTHEIADGIVLHMLSHHLFSEQSDTMKKVAPKDGAVNILTAHGSVIDPFTQMKLHTEQSPREIVIPDFLLNSHNWDYTMLGHIHERGWVAKNPREEPKTGHKIYYDGSLIRRGFSDKEVPGGRGWTLWNIEPDGTMTHKFFTVAQRHQEDFRSIDAANLSASEITDLIVRNLQNSPGHGEGFDEVLAPMLRQQIFNLTPAKHQSLDWKTIEQNSNHAFQWALKTSIEAPPASNGEAQESENVAPSIESGDVTKLYDDWISNSSAMNKVVKEQKDRVTETGREFIRAGQDQVLGQEDGDD